MNSTRKTDVSRFETVSSLLDLHYTLIDSIIELSPRDTVTRVRYVRASTQLQNYSSDTFQEFLTDTARTVLAQNKEISFLKSEKQSRCPRLVSIYGIFLAVCFLVFIFFLVYTRKKFC